LSSDGRQPEEQEIFLGLNKIMSMSVRGLSPVVDSHVTRANKMLNNPGTVKSAEVESLVLQGNMPSMMALAAKRHRNRSQRSVAVADTVTAVDPPLFTACCHTGCVLKLENSRENGEFWFRHLGTVV
jgi:hypothetical protein